MKIFGIVLFIITEVIFALCMIGVFSIIGSASFEKGILSTIVFIGLRIFIYATTRTGDQIEREIKRVRKIRERIDKFS